MKLFALGTHSDWYYAGGSWGKQGLQRIADLSAEAGIQRLYWRTHNGGQAKYPSKVCKVSDNAGYRDPDFKGFGTLPKSYFAYMGHIDYRHWDQLIDMEEIAASTGLEYAHWYTIFEDDHGGHLGSDFLKEHPEYQCRTRDGEPVPGCLDFWFPEVREYKRKIVEELLEKPAERLLLDFVRRNGKPSADGNGDYRYGYNPEKLLAFRKATGLDALALCPGTAEWERWLEFNAQPLTDFLLEIGERAKAAGRPLDLMVWPVDQRRWLALDLPAVARSGAVETILIGSHTYSYAPAEVARQLEAIHPQVAGSGCTVTPGLPAYQGLSADGFEGFVAEVERQGCQSMVLFESDAVLTNALSDRMRAVSLNRSHRQRSVTVVRTEGKPDWSRVPEQTGFLRTYTAGDGATDQETSFQMAHDGETLYLRVTCKERDPGKLLPVPCFDPHNYNMKQLGARALDPYESIHFFIDYHHQHENYARFIVDPSNRGLAGERINDQWPHPWSHEATIGPDRWTAELTLPLAPFRRDGVVGKELGFQLLRVQNEPREVSAWFNTRGRRIAPVDFGHLTLE